MDTDQIKTVIIIGIGTFIGAMIRGLLTGGQKPEAGAIVRVCLISVIGIVIAVLVIRHIK